jgi:hypothetical protein
VNVRGIELDGGWSEPEVAEIKKILAPLPKHFVEGNPNFKTITRRPVLLDAPPQAPGHSKYEPDLGAIVVFDKGVYHGQRIDPEQFRRSVYHELAHSILQDNKGILADWAIDTKGDGFIDDYAKTSPEEDFADTFSECLIHGDKAHRAVPRKASFIRKMITSSLFQ